MANALSIRDINDDRDTLLASTSRVERALAPSESEVSYAEYINVVGMLVAIMQVRFRRQMIVVLLRRALAMMG